ncbi:putative Signal recognition particle protein [Taphrina deformans PYCC 5710]|uniref:Signal recognition particle subunit SRP72 n=1 Tax=Taphrina deformans (strain PYCC 5710 / ATCC 11124 / CBS 356.35 / IMI 108563 / JCM 9778 / NBRC 8474) TaxID=1097556 RepID=R4X9V5_TAPDE|nr:putative Signal recognition particle protein [Taphrina deformans PYCC 5710]|eukprot:CCG82520.1 putative Signal recognition particle protein [Taphrina deformans PYCC 5710]
MAPTLEKSLKSLAISSSANSQVFALLEQDKFNEALKSAQSGTIGDVSSLYVAYAQYRLGREEECLRTLADAQDRASLHLRAQALYRLEQVSLSDLQPLSSGFIVDNEEADLSVNREAILAQLAALSKEILPESSKPSVISHEYLFNRSIYLAFRGQKEQAIELLEEALQTLNSLHLDSEDYDAEVAPIHAQMAHLTGDTSQNADAHDKITDSSTHFLTGINFLNNENPYANYKAYIQESRLRPSARLFSYQNRYVAYDRILAMHSIGLSIKKATKKYVSDFGAIDQERCSALKSLVTSKSATESLSKQLQHDPSDVDTAIALIAKTITQKHGVSKSIKIIEGIPEAIRYRHPGIIGVLCSLQSLVSGRGTTIKTIETALQQSSGTAKQELLAGWIQQTIAHASYQKSETSAIEEKIQELLSLDSHNLVAQCAQSYLHDTSTQEPLPLPDLSSIDIVSLELGTKRAHDNDAPQRTAKKTKVKSPEQIEAEKKLDPERWLPKRDRSSYKPSKKEKMKSKGGHQGGVVDESLSTQGPAQAVKSGEVTRKKKGKKAKK